MNAAAVLDEAVVVSVNVEPLTETRLPAVADTDPEIAELARMVDVPTLNDDVRFRLDVDELTGV